MRFIKQGKKGKKKHSRSRSKSALPATGALGCIVKRSPRTGLTGRQQLAVASAFVASTAFAGTASRAAAQTTAPSTGPGYRSKHAELPAVQFNIPAGPLDSALITYIHAAGVTVHTSASVIHGLQSPGVTGLYTPKDALKQLLKDTQLGFRFTDARTVEIGTDTIAAASLSSVSITGASAPITPSSPKYTEPLSDVPQTLVVIPQTVIQTQGSTTLRDVLRNVPGITINAGEGGSTPGDNFNVRGFSARSDMYVDGVRDEGGYTRDAFDFEQVEVAEGPASVYAGRGSTGGEINMVTKTPHLVTDRDLTLSDGTANQRRVTTDINQPINIGIPGSAVRLNAMWNDGGVPGNAVVENKGWGVAPSLALGLGTATNFTLAYTRTGQNNIPEYGVQDFTSPPPVDTHDFFGLDGLDFERVAANNLTAQLEHDFTPSLQLHEQITRAHSETNRIVTYTNITTDARSPKSHITDDDILDNQTSLTATATTGPIAHDIVTGVELSHEKSLFGHYTIAGTVPAVTDLDDPTTPVGYDPDVTITPFPRHVKANSVGAYAFDTMKLGQHVELNGGLRWDRFDPSYSDSVSHPVASSSAVSGRIGAVYKPTEAGSIYAAYGTSFNPSVQDLAYDSPTAQTLQPEENHSVEVGTKWELFKQRMLTSLAWFRTDKINARTPDPTDPDSTILDGNQRVQGLEAHATGNITPEWNVLAGYTYMEGKYLKSGTATQVGTQLNNVPKNSANLWTTYQLPKHLEVGGGMQYVDRRFLSSNSGSTWVPSYHLYNAEIGYHVLERIGIQLNINNLTNKLYYDNGRFWTAAPARSAILSTTVDF